MKITLTMPAEFIKMAKEQAKRNGLSLSAYIRTLILEKEK